MAAKIDLTGQVFGRLTVLEDDGTRALGGAVKWKCVCSCPNKTIVHVHSQALRYGKTKSCGCLNRELAKEKMKKNYLDTSLDLVGKHFGYIEVLEKTKERKNKSIVWKCQCINPDVHKEPVILYLTSIQLIQNHKRSCGCLRVSKGHLQVKQSLEQLNISFLEEYHFDMCNSASGHWLYFDFYLPDYNCCIEYDGEQHYISTGYYGGKEKLNRNQENDNIKNNYCKEHNIKLIRIPYWDFEKNKINIEYIKTLLDI